jgi:RNA polymerase sigma factor (sigma-70 family)
MSQVPPEEPQVILLANLPLIERIAEAVARRHGLSGDEADDLVSWINIKLIENDFAVLRHFKGESAISTYLTVVIARLSHDYFVRQWGRWRTSIEAREGGPVAVRLEKLLYRDGHTLDEAIKVLRSAMSIELSDREIAELAASLPRRPRDNEVGDEWLAALAAPPASDSTVLLSEEEEISEAARRALQRAISLLPSNDQLILRLRYWEGYSVAEIARMLHLDPYPLYRRINTQLARLRRDLEAAGVERDIVATLVAPNLHSEAESGEPSLVSVVADLDVVTPELVTELMAALDQLHRAHGGGGLRILGAYTGSAVTEGATA